VKSLVYAALLAAGLAAGAAQAQAPHSATGWMPGGGGNVVGGGLGATLFGGGDDAVVVYGGTGAGGGAAGLAQPVPPARVAGNHGDGPQVEYLAPAGAGLGREAWVTGGGDDAQVVYGRAR
jgi:hypothetical protein